MLGRPKAETPLNDPPACRPGRHMDYNQNNVNTVKDICEI